MKTILGSLATPRHELVGGLLPTLILIRMSAPNAKLNRKFKMENPQNRICPSLELAPFTREFADIYIFRNNGSFCHVFFPGSDIHRQYPLCILFEARKRIEIFLSFYALWCSKVLSLYAMQSFMCTFVSPFFSFSRFNSTGKTMSIDLWVSRGEAYPGERRPSSPLEEIVYTNTVERNSRR